MQTLTERSVNYDWGPQITCCSKACLSRTARPFCLSRTDTLHVLVWWETHVWTRTSLELTLLKRESVGLKDYCAAKTGNEIRVLESEEWVSWSKGYILLLRWAWGSSESGTFKTLFKWELQKEINLTSPLSRWSQLRDRETKSCCGETWTSCVCVLECSGAFNSLDL